MSSNGAVSGPLQHVDDYIAEAMRQWAVPGLAIAVVKDGETVLAWGHGVRRLGESTPVDQDTVFAIGSCTKAFTTAALGMLVDEGRIGWDDPVTKHLQDFRLYDSCVTSEITIRDLLCQRCGLPRHDVLWGAGVCDRDELVRRLRYFRPIRGFRSQFTYQNILYTAAGQIVPAVTGTSWDEFIKQRIFVPLGMSASSVNITNLGTGRNVATPHHRIDGRVQPIAWFDASPIGPAGSVNSTAADMVRWLQFQLDGGVHQGRRLLSTKAMEEIRGAQSLLRPEGMGPEGQAWIQWNPGSCLLAYGFGWILREYHGRMLVEHPGGLPGMRALVLLVPDEKIGLVILTNRGDHVLPAPLAQRIVDSYIGVAPRDWCGEFLELDRSTERDAKVGEERVRAHRVQGTKPSLPLQEYAGTYRDELFGEITVEMENGRLLLRYGPSLAAELEHWHHDTFRAAWNDRKRVPSLVTFRLGQNPEIEEIKIYGIGGGDIVAGRAPGDNTETALLRTD